MARDLIARHARPSIEDEIELNLDGWAGRTVDASSPRGEQYVDDWD
jgi:hypothetical protein